MVVLPKQTPSVTVGPPVEVSPLDPRTFRAITLSNQLNVLIVSDTASDRAAAALDVSVGSFSDPSHLPGLAHFLEHMLFLGTVKYPEERSYNNFLAENGGHSNAYTASENTNFHFEMIVSDKDINFPNNETAMLPKFKEALDRFSQFFTVPLFTESATEREINSVHSEHQKNLQNDNRRIYQVKKEAANPLHPYSKFGTGSKDTLSRIPNETGVDTRAALLNFYKTYYSANLMYLCITSPYSLDLVQEWVAELFSEIPNSNRSHPGEQYRHIQPLLEEHKGLVFHVKTIKDVRILDISWLTPPVALDYRCKAMRFVADLLDDEGEGSIISYLKKRGWCDSVSMGLTDQLTFSILQLSATLTNEGVDFIDEITAIVYQYIRMLKQKGVQQWLYEEEMTLANNSFRFLERCEPIKFVTSVASYMDKHPPAEYLSGMYLYKEFNPEKIHEILSFLTPENGNVVVAGKFVEGKTDRKEHWYETSYHVQRVDAGKLALWNKDPVCSDLSIPSPNPFIPTEFDLLWEPLPEGSRDMEGPINVYQDEYMEVHHKADRTFKRPKATVLIQFFTPLAYQSPLHAVMANLFTYLLEDALSEYSYPAERAGFGYQLDQATVGIRLALTGYSHRIDVLLDAVTRKVTSFVADPVRFAMQIDSIERNYVNFDMGQPYSRAMYNVTYLLEEPRWHVNDYLARIRDGSITVETVNTYVSQLRERLYISAIICGNLTKESAISMVKSVQESIGYAPLPEIEQLKRRVVQVPIGRDIFSRMAHPNPEDNNSAIDVFFQTGLRGNFVRDVTLELLADILNKPTFHELRTVQQLGYIVFEGAGETEFVRGIFIIVQSTVADPDELLSRIDKFLLDVREDVLEAMTEEKFQQYVSSLSATKAQPESNLMNQSFKFWNELRTGFKQYDRADKEIEVLQSITKEQVVEFFDKHIAQGGSERRRIISQIYGNQHPLSEKTKVPEGAIEVSNPVAFRRRYPLYPVIGYQ